MRNPLKNAWKSLLHNPMHIVFAIYRRIPWLIPNDELYLRIYYWLSLRKKLNLNPPVLYNEKLQWLKLYNRRPEYVIMVDKYLVKNYVAKIIGEQYVIPTIGVWDNPSQIEWDNLPNQFVLKTNHDGGGNGIVVCKDKATLNKNKALRELRHSFNRNTYMIGREWPYKMVKRKVFAEQYIEDETLKTLLDYKFYCFDGVVKAMFIVMRGEHGDKKINYYDASFKPLDLTQGCAHFSALSKPKCYDEMIQIAEKLSAGIPHVRVDLYEVNGKVYFGEYTFFDSGGTGDFQPDEWNKTFGDWITLPEPYEQA